MLHSDIERTSLATEKQPLVHFIHLNKTIHIFWWTHVDKKACEFKLIFANRKNARLFYIELGSRENRNRAVPGGAKYRITFVRLHISNRLDWASGIS